MIYSETNPFINNSLIPLGNNLTHASYGFNLHILEEIFAHIGKIDQKAFYLLNKHTYALCKSIDRRSYICIIQNFTKKILLKYHSYFDKATCRKRKYNEAINPEERLQEILKKEENPASFKEEIHLLFIKIIQKGVDSTIFDRIAKDLNDRLGDSKVRKELFENFLKELLQFRTYNIWNIRTLHKFSSLFDVLLPFLMEDSLKIPSYQNEYLFLICLMMQQKRWNLAAKILNSQSYNDEQDERGTLHIKLFCDKILSITKNILPFVSQENEAVSSIFIHKYIKEGGVLYTQKNMGFIFFYALEQYIVLKNYNALQQVIESSDYKEKLFSYILEYSLTVKDYACVVYLLKQNANKNVEDFLVSQIQRIIRQKKLGEVEQDTIYINLVNFSNDAQIYHFSKKIAQNIRSKKETILYSIVDHWAKQEKITTVAQIVTSEEFKNLEKIGDYAHSIIGLLHLSDREYILAQEDALNIETLFLKNNLLISIIRKCIEEKKFEHAQIFINDFFNQQLPEPDIQAVSLLIYLCIQNKEIQIPIRVIDSYSQDILDRIHSAISALYSETRNFEYAYELASKIEDSEIRNKAFIHILENRKLDDSHNELILSIISSLLPNETIDIKLSRLVKLYAKKGEYEIAQRITTKIVNVNQQSDAFCALIAFCAKARKFDDAIKIANNIPDQEMRADVHYEVITSASKFGQYDVVKKAFSKMDGSTLKSDMCKEVISLCIASKKYDDAFTYMNSEDIDISDRNIFLKMISLQKRARERIGFFQAFNYSSIIAYLEKSRNLNPDTIRMELDTIFNQNSDILA